jgi:predicted thioesterase
VVTRVLVLVVASVWMVAVFAVVGYAWLNGGLDVSAGTP